MASKTSIDELKERAAARVEELLPELNVLARDIWEHPELGYEERYATERIMSTLEGHGVPVEYGIAGIETALHATVPGSQQGPRVGILAEYDALAGLGHACGHNLIAASAIGTFLTLKSLRDELNGSVELFGTPAEEGGGGKIVMVEKHAFDGLSAAIMAHPGTDTGASVEGGYLASATIILGFHGKESHSAAAPTEGINALDALVMTYVGVNGLRQRLPKDINISNRISNGGAATNIIHGYAEIEFLVRASKWQRVEEVIQKVIQVGEGSAAAIGATMTSAFKLGDLAEKPYYMEDKQVPALQKLVQANLDALGIEQRPPRESGVSASSDFGNVTQIIPGIQPGMPIPGAVTGPHTPGFAVASGGSGAEEYLRKTIKMMAFSVIDILNEPGALEKIQADFAAG
jgi:amidohydrolase